ncbi:8-oxoguanine deaminase [Streptoalloteichus hindustanus]|uniref:Cytosine/adenosine deaminase n=1 Tax=Streptoalloteichus hindustanus TaxID=2017 RepID=A0A1M5Q0V6_STRHI|nr:8-oxoguanine deaminase [Streptoalloteichus hindustanus]SHH07668.1 Cytosine/adenosine deaminase [Streptoalloteichus hindustanus]
MSGRTVIENAAIAAVDAAGSEYRDGHVVVEGEWIVAVGEGPAPRANTAGTENAANAANAGNAAERRIDGSGCLVTPGLVNTHDHLFQWATRGFAQDATLYEWLTTLYPVWARSDAGTVHTAATAGLTRLASTGCTTAADHHYLFPRDGGDQMAALVSAAAAVGVRLHAARGSMDRGQSRGGLPPDDVVEDIETALRGAEEAIDAYHDPEPNARLRIAVGPCSPFTVSRELMERSAELARRKGVRLHTHLAETLDEERQCLAEEGRTPVEYADELGWLAEDVWLAHSIHLSDDAVRRFGATGTGVAHCPSSNGRLGAGIARVRDLLDAGAPVGLGVDGAASNESCAMVEEPRQALLMARQRGGPQALGVREALWLATVGGARCLGRAGELGSLEPGKLADLAVWRLDGLAHVGIDDPVAAFVLGPRPPLALLLVGGRTVVADDEIRTVDEGTVVRDLRRASRKLADAGPSATGRQTKGAR